MEITTMNRQGLNNMVWHDIDECMPYEVLEISHNGTRRVTEDFLVCNERGKIELIHMAEAHYVYFDEVTGDKKSEEYVWCFSTGTPDIKYWMPLPPLPESVKNEK